MGLYQSRGHCCRLLKMARDVSSWLKLTTGKLLINQFVSQTAANQRRPNESQPSPIRANSTLDQKYSIDVVYSRQSTEGQISVFIRADKIRIAHQQCQKNRSPVLLIITNAGSPINNRTVVYINMKMSRLEINGQVLITFQLSELNFKTCSFF